MSHGFLCRMNTHTHTLRLDVNQICLQLCQNLISSGQSEAWEGRCLLSFERASCGHASTKNKVGKFLPAFDNLDQVGKFLPTSDQLD